MSIDIGVSASDKKLILIQDEVRDFFGWDVESDTESAMQLLSAVELFSIDSWTRSQRLVTLANLTSKISA